MTCRSRLLMVALGVGCACARSGYEAARSAGAPADGMPDGDTSVAVGDHTAADGDAAPADHEVSPGDWPSCPDLDNDGFLPEGCDLLLPSDCAPSNPLVHPGAAEICDNGADEDCLAGDVQCTEAIAALGSATAGGVTTVENADFALGFDEAFGGVLTSIVIHQGGDVNLVDQVADKNEVFSAISHYNNWFSWAPDAAVAVEVAIAGAAMQQVKIPWSAGGPSPSAVTGTSTYTVYPDGRIHRLETVDVATTTFGHLLAYLAVRREAWDTFEWNTSAGAGTTAPVPGTNRGIFVGDGTDTGYGCARHAINGDLVGWAHHRASPEFTSGFRFDDSYVFGEHLLLSSEWIRNADVPIGPYHGEVLMLLGSDSDCSRMASHAAAFVNPPTMTVSAGALVTTATSDFDADGYDEGTGMYRLSAGGGCDLNLSVDTGTLPSLALSVESMVLDFAPVVRINGAQASKGSHYLFDVSADHRGGYLFVRGPLVGPWQLRITSPCPS